MVTLDELTRKYPVLWHMADPRNFAGILERGLLATSTLLDLLELHGDDRRRHERRRRPDDVILHSELIGTVILRDQRPLNVNVLANALIEGNVEDYLAFLNQRVFFWPTVERLETMNGARAYRDRKQLVFVVDSARLLDKYEERLLLSRINSGSTTRFAAKRSIATFQTAADYDWVSGKRQVAEITIAGGVPDILEYTLEVELWMNGARMQKLLRPFESYITCFSTT